MRHTVHNETIPQTSVPYLCVDVLQRSAPAFRFILFFSCAHSLLLLLIVVIIVVIVIAVVIIVIVFIIAYYCGIVIVITVVAYCHYWYTYCSACRISYSCIIYTTLEETTRDLLFSFFFSSWKTPNSQSYFIIIIIIYFYLYNSSSTTTHTHTRTHNEWKWT